MSNKKTLYEQLSKMKSAMGLNEAQSNLVQSIMTARPELAAAAQGVYDQWEQDEEEYDEMYGAGGICDDIADAMTSVLSNYHVDSFSLYNESDCHTSVYAYDTNTQECYNVDISPYNYETGTAYTWKKIPNVTFNPNMVTIDYVDYENYVDEDGNPRDDLNEQVFRMQEIMSLNEEEIQITKEPGTMLFFHGGDLDNINSDIEQKTDRQKFGSGLYLTTRYEVVQKYTKGSRKFYLVSVTPGTEIDTVKLPWFEVLQTLVAIRAIPTAIPRFNPKFAYFLQKRG